MIKAITNLKNINLLFVLLCTILLTGCGFDLITPPALDELTIENKYTTISANDGRTWGIDFEFPKDSTFSGVVRHINHWHDPSVPFMSHDVLITTEDFANPDVVKTWVFEHKFFYRYDEGNPKGTINLLHVFPATLEIYEQLQQIDKWDTVSISGREILKINMYNPEGKSTGYFKDAGCNTILVTSVTVMDDPTSMP